MEGRVHDDYTLLYHRTWTTAVLHPIGATTNGQGKGLQLMSARLFVSGARKSSRVGCICVQGVRSEVNASPIVPN